MTIINGVEYKIYKKDIVSTIKNNDKIENKLNVIIVISNPCNYKRRWQLALEFIDRMLNNDDVELFIVETIYGDQTFHVTDSGNKNHLQLRTDVPLWHKESMINCAVKKLLPPNWKAFAWIDSDLDFENIHWANDTLKLLNGFRDVIQLFSHCLDLDKNENTIKVFHSLGYQYETKAKYIPYGSNYSHCGYAWAMTRKAYERMGDIFVWSILGSGDFQMGHAFLGNSNSVNSECSDGYKLKAKEFTKRCRDFRVGYVPGVIRHYYHGSKKNRKYADRWQILVKHQYDPFKHVVFDENGLLVPSADCPEELLTDIMNYFSERLEDD